MKRPSPCPRKTGNAALVMRQPALDGLRVDLRRLRRKHGEIKTITVEYPAVKTYHENGQWKAALRPGGAQLDIELREKSELTPPVRDEITRLFWHSRLYPLRELWLLSSHTYGEYRLDTVKLNRSTKDELGHPYGPRPYGPYPEQHEVRA